MTSHFAIYLRNMNAPSLVQSQSIFCNNQHIMCIDQAIIYFKRTILRTLFFLSPPTSLVRSLSIQLLYSPNCMFSAKSLLCTQSTQFSPVSFYWCLHMLFNYGAMDVHATRLWFKRKWHTATHTHTFKCACLLPIDNDVVIQLSTYFRNDIENCITIAMLRCYFFFFFLQFRAFFPHWMMMMMFLKWRFSQSLTFYTQQKCNKLFLRLFFLVDFSQ